MDVFEKFCGGVKSVMRRVDVADVEVNTEVRLILDMASNRPKETLFVGSLQQETLGCSRPSSVPIVAPTETEER